MKFLIEFVPHKDQRYETVGDWQLFTVGEEQTMHIKISKMGNKASELAVAVHELVESFLCVENGITTEQVDEWDFSYKGDEPGDDPLAPYHDEHMIASRVETTLVHALGMSVKEHDLVVAKAGQIR